METLVVDSHTVCAHVGRRKKWRRWDPLVSPYVVFRRFGSNRFGRS